MRSMLRSFVENEVDPQALQYNREEKFNHPLFKRLGDLGILGVTVCKNNNFIVDNTTTPLYISHT